MTVRYYGFLGGWAGIPDGVNNGWQDKKKKKKKESSSSSSSSSEDDLPSALFGRFSMKFDSFRRVAAGWFDLFNSIAHGSFETKPTTVPRCGQRVIRSPRNLGTLRSAIGCQWLTNKPLSASLWDGKVAPALVEDVIFWLYEFCFIRS